MGDYKLVSVTKSNKPGKKLMAKFVNKKTGRTSVTHFGASGYDDYLKTKDKEQRARYRARHRGDNLSDPRSAGSASFFILWGDSTSKAKNIASYKRRFNL